jgi:glycosyltransferase involved in cell wall biosynthesis
VTSRPAPLVSVIIPVYNAERHLASTLESVLAQDYRPIEVLVIDDGSEDGSAEIARSFPEVRYFHQHNQGPGVARNAGLENARGELIAFLDADDLWIPSKLTIQVSYLLDHPETGLVFARQRIHLDPGVAKPSWLKDELLASDSVGYGVGTLVARKTVFDQVGGFDPEFVLAEDADWFLRAKDAGIPVGVVPDILLHQRIHGSNTRYRTAANQPLLLKAIRASIERQRKPGTS